MEIVKVHKEELDHDLMCVSIALATSNTVDRKYSTSYYTDDNKMYVSRKYIMDGELTTYNSCWLEFNDIFNVSHDDFTFKNMSGELNCSIVELDIYHNLYLYLINKIPEQELRNNISKLFNKDA